MDSDQKYQKKAEKKAKILIEKVLNQISSNEISQLEEKPFYPKKETHRQDICEACQEKSCFFQKQPEIFSIVHRLGLPYQFAKILCQHKYQTSSYFKKKLCNLNNEKLYQERVAKIAEDCKRYKGSLLRVDFNVNSAIAKIRESFRPPK